MLNLFIFSLFLCSCYGDDVFGGIVGDVNECEESCRLSYPPHTYPNGSEFDACLRGCRFFNIVSLTRNFGDVVSEFIPTEDDKKAPSPREMCDSSCVESYNETSSFTQACKSGCESQEVIWKGKQAEAENTEDEGINIHFVRPIMQVREIFSTIKGSFHIVRSSIRSYFIKDDNTMFSIESEPEVVLEILPEGFEIEEKPSDQLLGQDRLLDFESLRGDLAGQPKKESLLLTDDYETVMLMAIVFFVFVVVLFYAVYNHKATQKKKFLKSNMMMRDGDSAGPLPVKLVRPEDLTKLSLMEEEDQQAPALPTKVKIPNSTSV